MGSYMLSAFLNTDGPSLPPKVYPDDVLFSVWIEQPGHETFAEWCDRLRAERVIR